MWADSFEDIIPLCRDLEEKMIKLVWRHRHIISGSNTPVGSADVSALHSTDTSNINLTDSAAIEKIIIAEKEHADANPTPNPKSGWRWNWRSTPKAAEIQVSDLEKDGPAKKDPRPIRLYAPFYCGLAIALSICRFSRALFLFSVLIFLVFSVFIGSGTAILLAEWVLDDNYVRFALLATSPFLFSVALVGSFNSDLETIVLI